MKWLSYILLLSITYPVIAQQYPQSTQHYDNRFFYNPAVAGSNPYLEALSNVRYQWSGITNAPRSQMVSVQSSFNKSNSGTGGYLFNYTAGPVRNTGINLVYSYKLRVTDESDLSFGLGLLLGQLAIDGREIILHTEDDPLIDLTEVSSVFYPEFSFGAFWKGRDFYVGLSALNLTSNKTAAFPDLGQGGVMTRTPHIYLMGSYRYQMEDDFAFIPAVFMNYAINNPIQFDFDILMEYQRKIRFGLGYRTSDAMLVMAGITLFEDLSIGYSYDIQVSQLSGYSRGTHEIGIKYRYFYNELKKMQFESDRKR